MKPFDICTFRMIYLIEIQKKKNALSKKEQSKILKKPYENSNFVKNSGPLVCRSTSFSLWFDFRIILKIMQLLFAALKTPTVAESCFSQNHAFTHTEKNHFLLEYGNKNITCLVSELWNKIRSAKMGRKICYKLNSSISIWIFPVS